MRGWDRGEAWQKAAYDNIQGIVDDFAAKITQIQADMEAGNVDDYTDAWNALTQEQKQFYGKGLPADMPPTADQYTAMSQSDKEKVLYAYTRAAIDFMGDADDDGDATTGGFANLNLNTGITAFENAVGAAQPAPTQEQQDAARAAVDEALHSMSVALETKWDAAGRTVATQEDAQLALDAINNAIIEKDKVRAHLGALQNRLENTITNLNVQAENLQAAESRIRDVDVATEMTEFTRQQVLTQTAVAMLSQANSLPQMAMQLVGG
ncbi:MAG TPA: hypothetical protein H9857_04595 [Candidatus Desulfovibrio intestinigallinarum]|nr:hypothetical protein [Candidatus Desulfovibrio intestinigallinarum]